jgi:hypothetical protein
MAVTLSQYSAEILDSVDMTNSGWPDSTQIYRKINRARHEMYDLLVGVNENYFTERATITCSTANDYVVLPDGWNPVGRPAALKLINLYYPYGGDVYELRPMNIQEYRSIANTDQSVVLGEELRYIPLGNKVVFQGTPGDAFQLTLWYVPICPDLTTLLLANGNDFSASTWTKLDTARDVVTAYAAANPWDGKTTACSVAAYTSNVAHGVTGTVTMTAAKYNISVYAKKGASAFDWLYLADNTLSASCYFDLDAGVKGTASSCAGEIVDVGGGWYRCSITVTGTAAAHTLQIGPAQADTDNAFAGDGSTVDCYLWGAQVVQDSRARVYSDVTDTDDWQIPFNWSNFVVFDVCAQLMAREESDFNYWMARKVEAAQQITSAAMQRNLGKAYKYMNVYRRRR